MTSPLTRAEAELWEYAEIAVDTTRLWAVRSNARKIASEWAAIVTALRGVE